MKRDTVFLRQNNLMDYSMLVGIEKCLEEQDSDESEEILDTDEMIDDDFNPNLEDEDEDKFVIKHGARIMHFSIIDYL